MFKIIFMAMSADDPLFDNNLDILENTFETLEEAKKFMKEDEFPRCKAEWVADQEVNFEEYENNFIIEQSYMGDLQYRCEYKIISVEVK